jgi:glycine betaine/proline transport system substrate-binding protein
MKWFLGCASLFAVLLGTWAPANAEGCGSVTIASMNWQSAEVLSNVDKLILENGYGCDAKITLGDTVPTITSMAEKGEPDVAPEGWVDLLPEAVKRGVDDHKLIIAAVALPDGGVQGWWIPKYVADAHPDIKTISDMLKHPELFPNPDDPSKGAMFNGPQGWRGTIVTAQLFKAFGAEKAGFTVIDTGSAADLDGSIATAYEHKQPWVGYYWAPAALLGKYAMVRLDPGVPLNLAEWKRCITVANCPDPKPAAWPADRVYTLVAQKFADHTTPEVMSYLNTRGWDNTTVNNLMAWMTDNQATGEEGAKHFLKERSEIWTKWVTPEAAAKIKASL